ncbi:hypothetical protein NE237_005937 [Protea cynaroides]|uniref:Uncharacterized protein n=1 Tax=Protea cynaroides TaxID=273540 RepID=A0A9Q0QUU6_9MAGN|nr:hypothetical protein NE237_005937 [Protea cynaroides]
MEQILETLPEQILEKMKLPPKADDLSAKLSLIPAMSSGFSRPRWQTCWHLLEHRFPWRGPGEYCVHSEGPKKSDESLIAPIPNSLTSTTNRGAFLNSEVPRETLDLSLFSPKPRTVDSSNDVDLGSKIKTSLSQSPIVAPLGMDPCRPAYNDSEKIQDVETVENLEENIVDILTNVDYL